MKCSKCKQDKPESEFYDSEVNSSHRRCKECFRKRTDKSDRKSGRASMSFTHLESQWATRALRAMLTTPAMHKYATDPAFTQVLRKFQGMVERGARNKLLADVVNIEEAK